MFELETDFKTTDDYYSKKRDKNLIGPYLFFMYSDEKMEDEDNQDNSEKILDFIEEDRNFERRILKKLTQGVNNIMIWIGKTSEMLDRMNKNIIKGTKINKKD